MYKFSPQQQGPQTPSTAIVSGEINRRGLTKDSSQAPGPPVLPSFTKFAVSDQISSHAPMLL